MLTMGDSYTLGKVDGRRWASPGAEDADRAEELNQLDLIRLTCATSEEWKHFFQAPSIPHSSIAKRLYDEIHQELLPLPHQGLVPFLGPGDYDEFEKSALGPNKVRANDPSYVRGFADGALEQWAEIRRQARVKLTQ